MFVKQKTEGRLDVRIEISGVRIIQREPKNNNQPYIVNDRNGYGLFNRDRIRLQIPDNWLEYMASQHFWLDMKYP